MPIPISVAAVGSIASSLINNYAAQSRDAVQSERQERLTRLNHQLNEDSAARQRAAASAAQIQQERYNSEQAQVSRLKQAGLNPALLYGGSTSSSAISSPAAASSSAAPYALPSQNLDLSPLTQNMLTAALQDSQIRNMNMNTDSQAQDIVSKTTQNKFLEARLNLENMKLLQEFENLKKTGSLSDKELEYIDRYKESVISKISNEAEQSRTQSQLNTANVGYTSGVLSDLARSNIKRNEAAIKLDVEKVKSEKVLQGLHKTQTNSYVFDNLLKESETNLKDIQTKDLELKYNLDKQEVDLLYETLDHFSIPRAAAKGLLELYGEFVKGTGQGLSEFFSGDNWINFAKDLYRTNKWSKPENSTEEKPGEDSFFKSPPSLGDPLPNVPNDAVQTVPSAENLNKRLNADIYPNLPEQMRKSLSNIIQRSHTFSKYEQDDLKKRLYYAKNINDISQIINEYKNK